ncbi:MAG: anthranilate synthase component I family protein [Phycisphaerae bacterium]|nr:anthranilate synthase component I family protein [Phycisphaerae bacterium]
METNKPIQCKPHFQPMGKHVSLPTLADVISQKNNPAILGGNQSVCGYSIFAAEPVEVFEFGLDEDKPFEKLTAILSKYQSEEKKEERKSEIKGSDTFSGGWIGFFGYELGRFIEKLPSRAVDDMGLPVIRLAFYDKAIVYHHAAKTFTLVALQMQGDAVSVEEKFAALNGWLDEAGFHSMAELPGADMESVCMERLSPNMTQAQYMQAIDRIKHYIIDGDTYQINFSQRFEADFNARSIDLFHWQNRFNPSPYAAFLSWDDKAVVSASPELFLKVQGDRIVTKPIKGTRPRNPLLGEDVPENHRAFNDLIKSEKDQAELAMIVDLERNDLARICVPGTRHVTCARQIEVFPTVYHAAGIIEGRLESRPGPQRIIDILKATFPGGSITGAPKIRSMEIIDELEPTARGVYTGSIGWIGINFDLCFSIAIRTILINDGRAYVQTGGGIVADSAPDEEWAETLTKARALLAGIEAVQSPPAPHL